MAARASVHHGSGQVHLATSNGTLHGQLDSGLARPDDQDRTLRQAGGVLVGAHPQLFDVRWERRS